MNGWVQTAFVLIVLYAIWRQLVIEDRVVLTLETVRRIEAFLAYRPRVPPVNGCQSHNLHGVIKPGERCPGCGKTVREYRN